MRRKIDFDGPDFYPTPKWATYALIDNETFEGEIYEPACGDGAMSEVLKTTGNIVYSVDLYDRGYGPSGVDFRYCQIMFDNIVTNPPYNCAEQFINNALKIYRNKIAFLLRLAFLEGANREKTLFSVNPPNRVWVFSERITFYQKGAERKGSGTTAYAWFVWDKQAPNRSEIRWIKPGYRNRFGD